MKLLDYYVSIENTAYFHWQLGILIESFKIHDLEDHLVVAIAESSDPLYIDFSKNIKDHQRFFMHPNFGKHLNCYKSLTAAVDNGVINQPFAVIHPDMVLVEPIKVESDCEIIFSQGLDHPEIDKIEPDVLEAVKAFDLPREEAPATFSVGDVIVFNKGDVGDVHQILIRIERLIEKYDEDWNVSKAGIILAFYDLLSRKYRFRADFLESTLLHDELTNLLHYQHGMPPTFSKQHYRYDSPHFMSNGAFPMQPLLQHNPTVGTDYVQKIIRSYMDR